MPCRQAAGVRTRPTASSAGQAVQATKPISRLPRGAARPGTPPRRYDVLEREPDAAVDGQLLGRCAARMRPAEHLTQLGRDGVGAKPDSPERSHLDRERSIVADEKGRAELPRRHFGLSWFIGAQCGDVGAGSKHARCDEGIAGPRAVSTIPASRTAAATDCVGSTTNPSSKPISRANATARPGTRSKTHACLSCRMAGLWSGNLA
jgi:hypothetical protein